MHYSFYQCLSPKVWFHDSRRTNATLLLQQNTDLKTIQERLGHGDIRTTMNIYSHVTKEMQIKATDRMSEILKF
ncbi:tyrosine-type recombinase/integrase [Clostridium sp.]|uniref:tyrosine-type recombinase/integrase n=1 Tax=Clostridium sp. TaxID=1506 RepID=UPI003217B939